MSWWLRTPAHLLHFSRQLGRRDHAPLEQRLRERQDPLLVVRGAVVGVRGQGLDVLAQLVDAHQALLAGDAHAQHHEGVHPALPLLVVVLGALNFSRRGSAHVVMAADHEAFFHATHSETGALASCSGWQTISTSVGPPCESASFNTPSSRPGSVTLKDRTPNASATFAWSVTPKSTEK